jgi:anti-anti-sigma regulatory factor
MSSAALSILSVNPQRSVAQVVGDIGSHNAAWLISHLRQLPGNVVLDCRSSRFVDGSAFGVIDQFRRHLGAQGYELAVCGLAAA